jgi:hypothetical protein
LFFTVSIYGSTQEFVARSSHSSREILSFVIAQLTEIIIGVTLYFMLKLYRSFEYAVQPRYFKQMYATRLDRLRSALVPAKDH